LRGGWFLKQFIIRIIQSNNLVYFFASIAKFQVQTKHVLGLVIKERIMHFIMSLSLFELAIPKPHFTPVITVGLQKKATI